MASIRADMQLNAAPFLDGIAKVQTQMRNLQATAAGITAAFFAVRSVMAGLSGVFANMKGALDLGGKFADMSAATGASVSELVMLTQAFQNNGLAAEQVAPMIARFQRALGGVNEEGQSTAGALEKLGTNTLALSRMTVAQQFQELSRAFSAIEDPAERTRRAMELFGRSGAQMLTLFRDPTAFTRAAAEIGAMGDVLEANATRFDSMSDALTTLGQKMDQFFVGAMSSMGGADALEKAAQADFTAAGQSAGAVASALGEWMKPLQELNAFMTTRVPYFTQIRQAVEGVISPKMSAAAAENIGRQTEQQVGGFDARVRSVANEDERTALMEELGAAIEAARSRLDSLDKDFADLRPMDRIDIQNAITDQVSLLERQRMVLSSITPQILAANAAEAERAAALKASAAEAAKLAAQLDRALEARNVEAQKRILGEMAPADAEQTVLSQVAAPDKQAELVLGVTGLQDLEAAKAALDAFQGKTVPLVVDDTNVPEEKTVALIMRALGTEDIDAAKAKLAELQNGTADITITSEGVTAEIERLRAIGGEATDAERARLVELIDAEKTLLAIKQRATTEDTKRAEQAARLADTMADMALEADKIVAEAAGDAGRVAELEVEQNTRRMARQLEAQGMDATQAREVAGLRAQLDTGRTVGQDKPAAVVADNFRSIGLGGAAFAEARTPLNEIATRARTTNELLQQLIAETKARGTQKVLLAETFD